MVQGGQLLFPACAADGAQGGALSECWDEEALVCGQPGLVIFDGGSYSAGPAAIGAPGRRGFRRRSAAALLPLRSHHTRLPHPATCAGTPPDLQRPAAIPFDDSAAAEAAARLEAALAAAPAVDSLELVAEVRWGLAGVLRGAAAAAGLHAAPCAARWEPSPACRPTWPARHHSGALLPCRATTMARRRRLAAPARRRRRLQPGPTWRRWRLKSSRSLTGAGAMVGCYSLLLACRCCRLRHRCCLPGSRTHSAACVLRAAAHPPAGPRP